VVALAASADGSRIYAGGSFTAVGGVARRRLVSLDAATGAANGRFSVGIDATVRAIAVQDNRVYIGGDFVSVKGQSRPRLALLDGTTGALDPNWAPAADDTVRALAFSPDGSRLYAGGDFATVSGRSSPNLVGLSVANAGAASWQPLVNPNGRVYEIAASGASVYSAEAGPGGAAASYDAVTGARAWRRSGDGDVQAVAVLDGTVYLGGHFLTFGGQGRRFFAAVDATTGALDVWNPSGAGSGSGVWSLAPDPSGRRLYAGGDFSRVSGVTHQYFAQFSDGG
jgi:WD40 repeat protein